MEKGHSEILMQKLIKNSLSKEELKTLLTEIKEGKRDKVFSKVLSGHFDKIVEKFENK